MTDLIWPDGLAPYRVMHYLQPHVGGAESPITRTRKVYGLSAPRWVSRMTFRAGYDGAEGVGAWGGLLDALIMEMQGGLNPIALWDFRRPYPAGLRRYYGQFTGQRYPFAGGEEFTLGERFIIPGYAEPNNEAALAGSTTMTFTGFNPGEQVFLPGDYVGGDGRQHMVQRPGAVADADGRATVTIYPPLWSNVAAGEAITMQPTSLFQLVSEDAGQNETDVGDATEYTLDFVEKLP
jgi:hypothetical protein